MAVHAGKYGNVEYLVSLDPENPTTLTAARKSGVRNWVVSETISPFEYAHAGTKSGQGQGDGIYDYTGSFEFLGAYSPLMPGDYFNFEGFTAPDDILTGGEGTVLRSIQRTGQSGHPLNNRLGSIVESITINFDFTNGSIIGTTVNFAQANALPLAEVIQLQVDDTVFTADSICLSGVQAVVIPTDADIVDIATDTAIATWHSIMSATLTINSNNQTRVNSSTACNTARERGIISANLDVVEQSNVRPFALGSQLHLRLIENGNRAWNLRGFKYINRGDFRVDAESDTIIQQTNSFALKALIEGLDTTPDPDVKVTTPGYISRPGEEPVQTPPRSPAWPLPWWPNQYNNLAYDPTP